MGLRPIRGREGYPIGMSAIKEYLKPLLGGEMRRERSFQLRENPV